MLLEIRYPTHFPTTVLWGFSQVLQRGYNTGGIWAARVEGGSVVEFLTEGLYYEKNIMYKDI